MQSSCPCLIKPFAGRPFNFSSLIAPRPPRFSTDTLEATLSFAAKSPASHTYPQSGEKFPQIQGCGLGEALTAVEGRSPPRRAPAKASRRYVRKPEERSKMGIILSDMVGASCTVAPHGERRTDRVSVPLKARARERRTDKSVCATKSKRPAKCRRYWRK